ncbi:hypothetical protein GIB67_001258 [Kingdonia uniflora]|uniref:Protein prenyltransferase alpha subunit repeat-containing protein 1 n=1 Tax=Kingdonia uniflora TaxID=39325 RepID=A0A7J7LHA9_9MAGN|nr:hypothetical protein GIB67_001258 [Kingdonia uniflora]
MGKDLCSKGEGFHLLKQLEGILESDKLIDEVGFLHPTQFAALNEETGNSLHPSVTCATTSSGDEDLCHSSTIFWKRDHKLAISTQALLPLYNAAKHAYMNAARQYGRVANLASKTDEIFDGNSTNSFLVSEEVLEYEMMKHSKALLLLSCDFGSAWNSRFYYSHSPKFKACELIFLVKWKHIIAKKQTLSLFMDELLLSALILSYSPKAEHAWSHRCWVIKMIAVKYGNLQEIVGRDSELVEQIAEKSKMNYRAWNHRCWLISYMKREQVLDELNKSRKWAELHVADNCCFHYRQRLMLSMLEHGSPKQSPNLCSDYMPGLHKLLKEELDWDEMLIKRYIGREALWIHRRFLSQCWIKHFVSDVQGVYCNSGDRDCSNPNTGVFMDGEMQLVSSCLTIRDSVFEDCRAQAMLAVTYILWVSKQIPQHQGIIELQGRLRNFGDVKTLLNKFCPEKSLLWDGLLS